MSATADALKVAIVVGGLFMGVLLHQQSVHSLFLAGLAVLVGLLLWIIRTPGRVSITGRVVLITGCDSGFGHKLAQRLDGMGVVVFAGCLDVGAEGPVRLKNCCSSNLQLLQLDITRDHQVQEAFKHVQYYLQENRLPFWALVNNAGVSHVGEVEFCDMTDYIQVASVNLFGTINLTKTFLPLLRLHQGRVVAVTSMNSRCSPPGGSVYSVTQAGLESFFDCLHAEMHKWDVDVVLVEPGNYSGATNFFKMDQVNMWVSQQLSYTSKQVTEAYGEEYVQHYLRSTAEHIKASPTNMGPVIDQLVDALTHSHPNIRYMSSDISYWLLDRQKILMLACLYLPDSVGETLRRRWFYDGFPTPKAQQMPNFT